MWPLPKGLPKPRIPGVIDAIQSFVWLQDQVKKDEIDMEQTNARFMDLSGNSSHPAFLRVSVPFEIFFSQDVFTSSLEFTPSASTNSKSLLPTIIEYRILQLMSTCASSMSSP